MVDIGYVTCGVRCRTGMEILLSCRIWKFEFWEGGRG